MTKGMIIFAKIVAVLLSMRLNYQEKINEVESKTGATCLDSSYSNANGKSYRFTHNDIEHPDNFKPVAVLKHIPNPRCKHWSLSFYNTEENAVSAFNELKAKAEKKKKNLVKSFGDYLAFGELHPDDGFKGGENSNGHFECFINESIDLSAKFTVLRPLI